MEAGEEYRMSPLDCARDRQDKCRSRRINPAINPSGSLRRTCGDKYFLGFPLSGRLGDKFCVNDKLSIISRQRPGVDSSRVIRGFTVVINFVFWQCHHLLVVSPTAKLIGNFGIGKFTIKDAWDVPFK